jgi:hypothetical protein
MALSNATVWEVRPTVGSDLNGGGFVAGASGTDYSTQNSKNTVGNNISTTDAVGTGIATITSATAAFTSAIVGNIIYLSGTGVTTGWYQVVTFTNATTIILDRSPGTFTGATMNIGGALATVASVFPAAISDGNTFYIKATGSLTVTAALTPTNANSGNVMAFIGYTSTRGDGGRATWTTSTNNTNLFTFGSNAANFSFQNVILSCTAGTPGFAVTNNNNATANLQFVNCLITGWHDGIDFNWNDVSYCTGLMLEDCEVTACTRYGIVNSGSTLLVNCYIHGNGSHGFYVLQGSHSFPGNIAVFIRTVFYNNGGSGANSEFSAGQQVSAMNCAFVSNTGDGLALGTLAYDVAAHNCIFASNGGWGISATSSTGTRSFHNNAYFGNTSGTHQTTDTGSTADISISGSPFNSPSTDDFSLNGTAGAGAACKGAGYQGTLNGAVSGATSAAIDIGPVQSASSGGGGGGTTNNYIVAKNTTQVFLEEGY